LLSASNANPRQVFLTIRVKSCPPCEAPAQKLTLTKHGVAAGYHTGSTAQLLAATATRYQASTVASLATCVCSARRFRRHRTASWSTRSADAPKRIARCALPLPITHDPLRAIEAAHRYFSLGKSGAVQQPGPTKKEDLERELADDFEMMLPIIGPLTKTQIIGVTDGLDFAGGFPDFNVRYHAFRLDHENPRRVWCQMRIVATHSGIVEILGITAKPKDPPARIESPPEAVSITFNEDGKVREITTGYPLDRCSGTTSGLGGLFGVLAGAGFPMPVQISRSAGELLAPIIRPFGAPIAEAEQVSVPSLAEEEALSEEKLLAWTEQLINADLGLQQPSLLAESFVFTGPAAGPLNKECFLERAADNNITEAFPDIEFQYRDLRVCQFDRNRVWYTSSPKGTHSRELRIGNEIIAPTGRRWESPPICGSAMFNNEGKCIYLTGDYVMDRRMGNTKGLAGTLGIQEAIGFPSSWAWVRKTPTQLIS